MRFCCPIRCAAVRAESTLLDTKRIARVGYFRRQDYELVSAQATDSVGRRTHVNLSNGLSLSPIACPSVSLICEAIQVYKQYTGLLLRLVANAIACVSRSWSSMRSGKSVRDHAEEMDNFSSIARVWLMSWNAMTVPTTRADPSKARNHANILWVRFVVTVHKNTVCSTHLDSRR